MVNNKHMFIPFHRVYMGKEELRGVICAIKSGWITMGPKTEEFEEKFKNYLGAKYAITVNSCTAGLHLALETIGLKEKDEVLVPAISFTSTAEVVSYFKAKPVFVDVDKDTLNINISDLRKKITRKTKAIIPVDYAGQPPDLDEIMQIAKKHRLFVIEDAAHALPSWYKNRKIGGIADITVFSFYATKTLSTGEGGMIVTSKKKWAQRIKMMRLHGIDRNAWKRYAKKSSWYYEVEVAGYKYNSTDINAALGLAQLNKLEFMWQKRKAIAETYNQAFKDLPQIMVLSIMPDRITSWHLYVIKLNLGLLKIDRARFIFELNKQGISAGVHFIPLYRHPFYKNKFGYKNSDFPNSEWVYQRIVSLPIYPGMSKAQIKYVINGVRDIVQKYKK